MRSKGLPDSASVDLVVPLAGLGKVRIGVEMNRAGALMLLTIRRADALGFSWFGLVKTQVRERLVTVLRARNDVLSVVVASNGTIRVRWKE